MTITAAARALMAAVRAPEPVQGRRSPRRSWTGPAWSAFLLAAMVTVLVFRDGAGGDLTPPPVLVAFTVLAWLPLLIRDRRPRAALVGVLLVESLHVALVPLIAPGAEANTGFGAYQPVPLATMAAAWAVASRTTRGWIWGGAAALVLLVVGVAARPLDLLVTDLVTFNVVLLATGAGALVTARRERTERQAREHRDEVRQQVTQERLRIARDLHDVLAHHLALVNAQAEVAAYLVRTDPATATTALDGIADHSRKALDGLRATVGLLRHDGTPNGQEPPERGPLPSTERLEGLLDPIRATGTLVTFTVSGIPHPLDPAADLATFRIVQEALTNATKHAPGAPVQVTLAWSAQQLDICVHNDPPPVPPIAPATGTGHGLLGMSERALACGGHLDVQRPADGGFIVRASIPTAPPSPAGRTEP